MVPGLHPGLLLDGSRLVVFRDVPDRIYIGTSGGPGPRPIGLFIQVEGGVPPYDFDWTVDAGDYTPIPSAGSGSTPSSNIGFTTSLNYGGLVVTDEELVGYATLNVTAANGVVAILSVEVYAGP